MDDWRPVCRLDDVPVRGARTVRIGPATTLALFRTAGDEVLALDDRCPHRGGPLSQGLVTGDRVVCPLHGWTIGLRDGAAVAPDEGRVDTFAVQVRDGCVYVAAEAFATRPVPPVACAGTCAQAPLVADEA